MQQISKLILTASILLTVASCNIGTSNQTAGIDRGGVVSGPVTGYGSIWVNGERYATTGAEIEINGQLAGDRDLEVGQVVVLDAEQSATGLSAKRVVYESNLRGPIDSLDLVAGSLVALGQQIIIDSGTLFGPGIETDPASPAALAPGDIVEVSGLVNAMGGIRATLVARQEGASYELQLSGIVTALVPDQNSFRINGQSIVYAHNDFVGFVDPAFPGGLPVVGDRVRVIVGEGVETKFNSAGEVLASTISYRGRVAQAAEGDEGEIEGLIANCSGASNCSSFELAGFAVMVTTQTRYEPESGSVADLANNKRIEADGNFDAAGILVADKIEFRIESDAEIDATVDGPAIVTGSSSGQSLYSLSVAGVNVVTTPLTSIKGESKGFSPADLVAGDYLRVRGAWDGRKVVATLLEQTGIEDKYEIEGVLTSASEPYVNVLGSIDLLTNGDTEYEQGDDTSISAAEFFLAADQCLTDAAGCKVEVEYDWQAGVVIKLELAD